MSDYVVPDHVTQRDGSRCQFSSCWAAQGVWLQRAATGNTAGVSVAEFRRVAGGGSGRVNPASKCRAGLESDIVAGLTALGVRSRIIRVPMARARHLLSTDHRAVYSIACDYDVWPTPRDCMRGNVGPDVNHQAGIVPGIDERGTVRVSNPLCLAYQRVRLDAILRAAAKYSRQQGRSTIWMIRVLRPLPPDTSATDAVIADLEARVADLEDSIAEARAGLTSALEALR